MIHEPELKKIYYEAYFKISLLKSNGKKGLPTRHGVGLRAVWDAAIASTLPGGTATSAELCEALGASKNDAARLGTRLDSIATGGPKGLPPSGDREG